MSILEVKDLNFGYTNEDLYTNLSFEMNPYEHICLVGPNGAGKSTFMKIIVGKITPDKGTINWLNGIEYQYLDQQLEIKKDIKISEYLYGVYEDLFKREKQMNDIYLNISSYSDIEMDKMLERAESIREYLEMNDFYNIETEINNVIVGLGLQNIDKDRMLSSLSGGEKMKVYLAKLLLSKPDCILMDEPTNFLDKCHVEWLIDYLNSYKNAFLVISHDQEFLKRIAKVVYAIESKKLNKYNGSYDFYLKEKDLRISQQQKAYVKQQELIKRTNIFIEKNRYKAKTASMAQSRIKMLDKLEKVEKPKEEYQVRINFPFSRNLSNEVIKFDNLLIGYDKPLLPEFSYLMKQNERIEIIGKNGIGKTTLIKTIMGILKPISGSFKLAPSIDFNYFSQEEEIDLSLNAIDYLRLTYPLMTNEDCLKTLAPLGIKGELARKKMEDLSGGEVGRVRLSLMTLKKSNLLVLDEPTNHLDKLTKEALHKAIEEFPGSVILVSHEMGFADSLIDTIIKF